MSSSDLRWCSWSSARSKQWGCSCDALLAPAAAELKCLCQCLPPGPADRQSPGVGVYGSARERLLPKRTLFFFPTL